MMFYHTEMPFHHCKMPIHYPEMPFEHFGMPKVVVQSARGLLAGCNLVNFLFPGISVEQCNQLGAEFLGSSPDEARGRRQSTQAGKATDSVCQGPLNHRTASILWYSERISLLTVQTVWSKRRLMVG